MEADARTLLTFIGPLAIMYMTYSSITGTPAPDHGGDLKTIAVGQISTAPKLPSVDGKHRNPFVPRSGTGGGDPTADASAEANPEKDDKPLHLDGTVIAGKIRFAIINGLRVTEGDYFRNMRLSRVDSTQVTLTGESEQVVLPLEIAKSDSIHAPAATIVSGSHAPSRPTASNASTKPASVASGHTANQREPSNSASAGGNSLLVGSAARDKPASSKVTKSGTSRR